MKEGISALESIKGKTLVKGVGIYSHNQFLHRFREGRGGKVFIDGTSLVSSQEVCRAPKLSKGPSLGGLGVGPVGHG